MVDKKIKNVLLLSSLLFPLVGCGSNPAPSVTPLSLKDFQEVASSLKNNNATVTNSGGNGSVYFYGDNAYYVKSSNSEAGVFYIDNEKTTYTFVFDKDNNVSDISALACSSDFTPKSKMTYFPYYLNYGLTDYVEKNGGVTTTNTYSLEYIAAFAGYASYLSDESKHTILTKGDLLVTGSLSTLTYSYKYSGTEIYRFTLTNIGTTSNSDLHDYLVGVKKVEVREAWSSEDQTMINKIFGGEVVIPFTAGLSTASFVDFMSKRLVIKDFGEHAQDVYDDYAYELLNTEGWEIDGERTSSKVIVYAKEKQAEDISNGKEKVDYAISIAYYSNDEIVDASEKQRYGFGEFIFWGDTYCHPVSLTDKDTFNSFMAKRLTLANGEKALPDFVDEGCPSYSFKDVSASQLSSYESKGQKTDFTNFIMMDIEYTSDTGASKALTGYGSSLVDAGYIDQEIDYSTKKYMEFIKEDSKYEFGFDVKLQVIPANETDGVGAMLRLVISF